MKKNFLKYLIIINGAILAICMFWPNSGTNLADFIVFLFLILLSSLWQLIVFLLARRFKTSRIIWAILFLFPSLYLTFDIGYHSLPQVKIRQIIRDGRLSEIPKSAKNLKVYTWHTLFSGESFLCFEASPAEIQKFISGSDSLKDVEPKVYSENRMRIPYPLNYNGDLTHDYFIPDTMAPKWLKEELRNKGRVYEIPFIGERGHNSGIVIIDDLSNTVYIKVVWS